MGCGAPPEAAPGDKACPQPGGLVVLSVGLPPVLGAILLPALGALGG